MGIVNDMSAIAASSNVYFFNVFIKLANALYSPGQPLNIEEKYFDIVRSSFSQFGLGVST